ncbi:hypothetical protein QLX08_009209 [Tetragonisca angustula]|uniref:Uncharacterized protein n=1 Tax=Tetragonisca angustula TaxID=166442 RepID=A0AAW0ZHI6_9HYME
MASSSDSQNLSEAIASLAINMETLYKQVNKQNERASGQDELFRKIAKRSESHDQTLEKLTSIIKKLETAHEEQNRELKRLANNINACTYSETVHRHTA